MGQTEFMGDDSIEDGEGHDHRIALDLGDDGDAADEGFLGDEHLVAGQMGRLQPATGGHCCRTERAIGDNPFRFDGRRARVECRPRIDLPLVAGPRLWSDGVSSTSRRHSSDVPHPELLRRE